MQSNSVTPALQKHHFSSSASIGGIRLPNFDDKYVYTKTKSKIRDAQFITKIKEQAYADYKRGHFQNASEDFNKLMKQYVSVVSPDRYGIITTGLNAIAKNDEPVTEPIDFVATILEGEVRYQKLPSEKPKDIEFYDKNGEMVAKYSNNSWTIFPTKAENARQVNMCNIYNKAWNNAKDGIPLTNNDSLPVGNDKVLSH